MASSCFLVKISPDLINSFTDLFPCRKSKHHILFQLFLLLFEGFFLVRFLTCVLAPFVFGTVSRFVVLGDLGLAVLDSFCTAKETVNLLKRQPAKMGKKSLPAVYPTEDYWCLEYSKNLRLITRTNKT